MSLVDRDALARCCALLGSLSWLLAILSVAAAAMVLGEVAAIPSISGDTVAAADQAAAQAWESDIASNMIRMFTIAAAAFVSLAIAPVAAALVLTTGRQAWRAGCRRGSLACGFTAACCYLALTAGFVLRAVT